MNVLEVTWKPPTTYFKIPSHWRLEDIEVRWHKLYYKGVEQEIEAEEVEGDGKRPATTAILEGEDAENILSFLG
jgi:hypothetical protein